MPDLISFYIFIYGQEENIKSLRIKNKDDRKTGKTVKMEEVEEADSVKYMD